jgi:hypothetical protein
MVIYPNAFDNEDLKKIGKKHGMAKHEKYIREACSKENFKNGLNIFEDVAKIVSRSSLVSVFEKMRFRDLMKEFDLMEKREFLDAVYENLHGNERQGFERLVNLLDPYKLAKWPIITIFQTYYNPKKSVFMKPTTVKKIIKYLELDLKYVVRPDFTLYKEYKKVINEMKKLVDKRLSPSNPAFSGFLMLTIE